MWLFEKLEGAGVAGMQKQLGVGKDDTAACKVGGVGSAAPVGPWSHIKERHKGGLWVLS